MELNSKENEGPGATCATRRKLSLQSTSDRSHISVYRIQLRIGWCSEQRKTLAEAFHNAAMMWIRQLVARRMNGEEVNLRTRWGKMSLSKLMRIAQKYLSRYGMHREFAVARGSRRSFMKRICPHPPRLVAGDGSNTLPCGVTANDLSLSVRRSRESFRSYLSKITRLYTWGRTRVLRRLSRASHASHRVPEKSEPYTLLSDAGR